MTYQVLPILQQDLIGNASNYYSNKTRWFVFGRAPDVDNVKVDLWEGPTTTYVFPTAAVQMTVVSSSANDAAAGTGVRQVLIHYLDASYAVQSETVTLNGTTPVNTVATDILRINGVHAVSVGSGGVAAGNLSVANGGITYGYIKAGDNTARQAIFTIPAGKTGYISHWQTSSGAASGQPFCQTTLLATTHDGIMHSGVFLVQDEQGTQNGGITINFPTPIPVPAQTDIKLRVISNSATANAVALGTIMGWFE